ncbi:hypothetical protein SAMN04487936_101550 [Halobacillus dabanensis]|uniref:Uncharacterized protein n=1 Tax=Halobacillus dabanensis TaxID=240302 RepID=A0A1I3Q608_HALDA|nr:hypothetical protein [Halobacillus dabanensis]SFJ29099.1 hypothetical protein SAMN04487936_101550 [Halobacillus dabanensis]
MGKKDWMGIIFFLGGILLYGLTVVGVAVYMPQMTGWSDPPGKYWAAIQEMRAMFPLVLSWILILLGLILLFWENMDHLLKKFSN